MMPGNENFVEARIGRSLSRNRPLCHYQFVILPRECWAPVLAKQRLVSARWLPEWSGPIVAKDNQFQSAGCGLH